MQPILLGLPTSLEWGHNARMGSLLRFATLSLFVLLTELVSAQTTTIQLTSANGGNTALSSGQLCLVPVTPAGQPQTFSANGSLYLAGDVAHVQGGFCGPISAGSLTSALVVPDRAAATAAYPLCYEELIVDSKGRVSDLGTRCDITGATISLNTYIPPSTVQFAVSGYTSGPTVPASCVMAALRLNTTNNHLYSCGTDSIFHDLTGSGGGGGSSLNFRGAWAASTAYAVGDVVQQSGSSYVATTAFTSASSFNASSWTLLAAAGANGAAGATGATGPAGPTGPQGPAGAAGGGSSIASYAFSAFPAIGITAGQTVIIQTDAVIGSSCTVGGGATRRLCVYTGSAWAPADNFAAEKNVINGVVGTDANARMLIAQLPQNIPLANIQAALASAGVNTDTTKNGAVTFTYTGTAATAPGANSLQVQQAVAVPTPYILSYPGSQPDAIHTIPSFVANGTLNGVPLYQATWVSGSGSSAGTAPGEYFFNEGTGTATANQGTGPALTLSGGSWVAQSGLSGGAYAFNGTSTYATVASATTAYNFSSTQAFGVCAWFSTTSTSNYPRFIGTEKYGTTATGGWEFGLQGSGIFFELAGTGGYNGNDSYTVYGGAYSANSLVHACASYSGSGSATVWVNHTIVSLTNLKNSLSTSPAQGNPLYIGGLNTGSGINSPFTGNIGPVTIINRALTQSDVDTLYGNPYAKL